MNSPAVTGPTGSAPAVIDRIRRNLVGLKMPRALEILDVTLRGIERGETTALEALDLLLTEELTLRENRRVKMALIMARLSAIKTLAGFDFSFQPSLDKNRIMALAELQFIDRAEVVHLIGPPGTGKSHLSLALGVEAVKAGRSVYFGSLADIVAMLAKAEREGTLREKIRFFCRFALLIVDEIGEGREVDGPAGFDGFHPECQAEMTLAGAWRPNEMHDLGTVDELQFGKRHDAVLVEGRLEREVEAGQRLYG